MAAHPGEQGEGHSQRGGMRGHHNGFLIRELNVENCRNDVSGVREHTPDPYE